MNGARLSIITLAITTAVFYLAACSDNDSPATPTPFSVTITVTDPDGSPVQGLNLSLAPETPFYGEKTFGSNSNALIEYENRLHGVSPNPFNPATRISCELAAESHLRLCIEDIEGTELRLLVDQIKPSGIHNWQWNGLDENGDKVASGVYTAHLIITNASDDTVIHDESHHMLIAAWGIDYATVDVTNADGQIVLTDKRLFPFLYGIDGFNATDEGGEIIGTIMLTASMRFYLADPGEGILIRYNHDITGAANLNFTWDPSP